MNQFIPLLAGVVAFCMGATAGYYARQSIAKRNYRTIEAKIQKKIGKIREEKEAIVQSAKQRAEQALEEAQKTIDIRRKEFFKSDCDEFKVKKRGGK